MEPLVPAEVDLRDFGFMPLDVRRLLSSETWIEAADEPKVGHAVMCLWAESWHQVPAASLPDNDRVLARLAMCDAKEWKTLKEKVMAGWVKCSDGLLYHPVVAEKALESWKAKCARRARTRAATEAREARKHAESGNRDDQRHDERDVQRNVVRDEKRNVHQGTVKGQGQGHKEQIATTPNPSTAAEGNPGGRRKRDKVTFDAFLQTCHDADEKPIRRDDPIFQFAKDACIPVEFLHLAWREFAGKHTGTQRLQKDWRAHFRDAVRRNWFKLWWMPSEGTCELTTAGVQLRRELEAERLRQQAEDAAA